MKFKIKEAREKIGLSQKELAQKLGIKPTTFNGYETGAHDPKSEILTRIALACNTSVDFLLGLENTNTKKSPAPEEPEPEDFNEVEFQLFCKAMVTLGYLREGEDFTDAQVQILAGVIQILDAAFPRFADSRTDETRAAG